MLRSDPHVLSSSVLRDRDKVGLNPVADPESPLEPKLFHFHGECQTVQIEPPSANLNPDPKILDLPLESLLRHIYHLTERDTGRLTCIASDV